MAKCDVGEESWNRKSTGENKGNLKKLWALGGNTVILEVDGRSLCLSSR